MTLLRRTPLRTASALLFTLSATSPLLAQTTPEGALPEVTVKAEAERANGPVDGYRATRSGTFTKTDTPLKEVPASVTVVPAELMKDQAMRSMADVIRYVPGALAHQGEGNRDEFILRGISTSANLYLDGIRDDAQIFRDLYNLERVEVLKGAGSMIFGRGAGGVINRVSKMPTFDHIGEASATIGSWGQLRGTLDVGEKINDAAAWRLNLMGEGSDSFRDGFDMKRYAINPSLLLKPSAQTSLLVGFEHAHDERTADRGVPSQNGRPYYANRSTFYGNAEQSEARSTVDSFYTTLDHDFGGGTKLKNSFRITHYDKFYQNVFAGSAVASNGTMKLSAYNNANQRTNVFNQTDLTTQFKTGAIEHTLLLGTELGHQDSTNKRNTGFFGASTTATVSAANPYATVTSFRPNANDADNNVTADIAAVYLQDQLALNKEVKVLAGVRYDYFKTSLDDRRALGTSGQTVAPTDLSRIDRAWSPRLGLIWTPDSRSSYYASYSTSFIPSADTLGLSVLNAATGLSTADFAPEKVLNYEIGGRWDLTRNLALSAALFRLDRNNVRNADGNGGYYQVGQQRTDGFELGLQGDVMRNWQVYAGYAYLDSRITKATAATGTLGNRPQLVPVNTASIWNRFNLGHGWGTALGAIYQGASYTNADNLVRLPGFVRFDGALYYAFPDGKTRVALNVENLLDRNYYPTANSNYNITVGAPRNARLTLSMAF